MSPKIKLDRFDLLFAAWMTSAVKVQETHKQLFKKIFSFFVFLFFLSPGLFFFFLFQKIPVLCQGRRWQCACADSITRILLWQNCRLRFFVLSLANLFWWESHYKSFPLPHFRPIWDTVWVKAWTPHSSILSSSFFLFLFLLISFLLTLFVPKNLTPRR